MTERHAAIAAAPSWLQPWLRDLGAPVEISASRGSRLRLAVRDGVAYLSVPRLLSAADTLAFLHKETPWLKKNLAKQTQHLANVDAGLQALSGSGQLLLFGRLHAVSLGPAFARNEAALVIPDAFVTLRDGARRRIYLQWLAGQLRDEVTRQLPIYTGTLGVRVQTLTIKPMRSRWGSMSSAATMSLSLALAFAPPSTIGYVLAHELAHVHEFNHSAAFWQHVAHAYPAFRHERDRLKREGGTWMALQQALRGR